LDVKDEIMRKSEKNGENIILLREAITAAMFLNKHSFIFWSNVFIGIFSSGFLALILSIAAYRIERQSTLERFYVSVKVNISL